MQRGLIYAQKHPATLHAVSCAKLHAVFCANMRRSLSWQQFLPVVAVILVVIVVVFCVVVVLLLSCCCCFVVEVVVIFFFCVFILFVVVLQANCLQRWHISSPITGRAVQHHELLELLAIRPLPQINKKAYQVFTAAEHPLTLASKQPMARDG